MNWFGGNLVVKWSDGHTTTLNNVSLARAQHLLDDDIARQLSHGVTMVDAMYYPHPTSMGPST